MNLRKIAALVGGGALAVSLIGAGVGASFNATTAAYQHVSVGNMAITITPLATGEVLNDNGTITCPAILITTEAGVAPACSFRITNTGSTPASHIVISGTESGLSPAQLLGDKFFVCDAPIENATGLCSSDMTSPSPWTFNPAIGWGQYGSLGSEYLLDNSDMNTVFDVTFTITIAS